MSNTLVDLDKLLSLSSVHIYWLDRNNLYQGCNDTYALNVGLFSRADIVGKRNHDLPIGARDPATAASWDKANLEIMETGEFELLEENYTLMDGTEAVFLSHKVPLKDSDGKIIGLMGISTNITNQKIQEDNLRREKERAEFTLDYIVTHLPEHIYWKDKDGIYLGSNDQQARSLGLQCAKEIIGKTDFELPWGKKKAEIFRKNDIEVMRTGIAKTTEEPSVINGKRAIVLSRKVPLRTKRGEIVGVIGISIDITDRKEAEDLRIKHAIAEKVAKFSNLVAGSVAHEVRTPLGGISAQIDLLDMTLSSTHLPPEKEEVYKEVIKDIKQIVKNSVYVINDMLLKVKSFATGKLHHNDLISTSITTEVERFLTSYPFDNDSEKKLIKLKNFDDVDFQYIGNSLLTQHVLCNLLKNALFAIKNEGKGDITIELQVGGSFNKLLFRDTASGIPEEFVAKLFDQFETKKTIHGGTGLGLAFCKMVMESYGGDITCNSKEGEFTEFVLSFPKV